MRGAIKVTVAAAVGSTPREAGAEMLVFADRIDGTIGGGALEWRAIERARQMLSDGIACQTIDLPLGPALQQCCGGHVRLTLAATEQPALAPLQPLIDLSLYGAGHVGRAVVEALAALPIAITWHDSRADAFPERRPPGITVCPATRPPDEPDRFHLVMTHSHALDLEIVAEVLHAGSFGWLGLIGSATKRARFVRELRARGLPAAQIARMVCPIGIAGIGGKAPAVIAASVAAQLLIAAEAQLGSRRNRQLVTAPE